MSRARQQKGGDETRPGSILVVDDRPENLQALEAALEPLGRRIVTAQSGQEALRLLLSDRFAVILLDVQMPGMDGFETAAYIRRRERTRTIPIIFLTAISSSPEHVFRGYEAGAVDYIVKPIDPAILRSKVAVFVELYEKTREIERQANLLKEQELERAERTAAERRHKRTRFLASAASALEQRLDVKTRLGQLVQACVPELADLALVALIRDDGGVEVAAIAHRGPDGQGLLDGLIETRLDRAAMASWVVDSPESRLVSTVDRAALVDLGLGDAADDLLERLSPRALIVVPLVLGGRALGFVVLGATRRRRYGEEELDVAQDLARKASFAVENAQLYEAERDRSRTLQLSLLGRPVATGEHVAAAMRYLAGAADLEVGGDWYVVVERDDGRILVVVGDVVGRGVRAATAMGKLRSATAALALVVDSPPELLSRLDQFAEPIDEARFGTVAAVLVDPASGLVRYSLAGHPPPLVVTPDGHAEYLEGGSGVPLCVSTDGVTGRVEATTTIEEGSTIVLYTDGLVERRDLPIDEGLERLRAGVAERARLEPERLCDELVDEFAPAARDDVVILCLRLEAREAAMTTTLFPAVASGLRDIRLATKDWLMEQGVHETAVDDVIQACAEACANAAQHAYAEDVGQAELRLCLRPDGLLVVRVRDWGRWSPRTYTEFGGRGIDLMRVFMDDVHIHKTRHGTTVVMTKDVSPVRLPLAVEAASLPAA